MNTLLRILAEHLRAEPLLGAEVGVMRGETSRALLKRFGDLTLWMIDSWATYPKQHPYRRSGDRCSRLTSEQQAKHKHKALRNTAFAGHRRVVLHADAHEAAACFQDESLDFAFLDADHTYPAVRQNLQDYWPKVKPGGVGCGHDWGHPRDRRGVFGVKRAVDEFFGEGNYEVLKDVWFKVKPTKPEAPPNREPRDGEVPKA